MMNKKRTVLIVIVIIYHSPITLLLARCCARIFAGVRGRKGKRPVIVIPGILGSRIVNRRTGEVVWPSVFRSDVDGLSLPTTPDLVNNRDELDRKSVVQGKSVDLGGR